MKKLRLKTTNCLHSKSQQRLTNGIRVYVVLSLFTLLSSCQQDYFEPAPLVFNPSGFRLSMGGQLTRSVNADQVLDEMQIYCFDRSLMGGNEPEVGTIGAPKASGTPNGGSLYHHTVRNLVRNGLTLSSDLMRAGKWDAVMVSPQGATFTSPVHAKGAGAQLMYTYNPALNQGQAHEFYHNYCRLPEITANNNPYVNTALSRNVAKVRVVIERAVEVDPQAPAGAHTVTLDGIPQYISWAGTLLKKSGGNYSSDKDNFDVFPNGTPEFIRNVTFTPAHEAGTFMSDTIDYIIPAHRGSDYWVVNSTTNSLETNPTPTDTITKNLTLSVNFTKPSGSAFAKSAVIPYVAKCNKILVLKVRVKDVNIEIKSDVLDWAPNDIEGNVKASYLNVSKTSTEVFDGAVSRIYFWTNQKADSVYVTKAGRSSTDAPIADINTIFDRLAGTSAANLHFPVQGGGGYIDICHLNTSSVLLGEPTKIYLNAGGLRREIIVNKFVTTHAAKNITTPYIGTFHRASQKGERVITWHNDTEWNAVVEGPAASEVLIDRQYSPSFSKNALYSTASGDPELAMVGDWKGSVTGNGRIYFRVGWKSRFAASEAVPARYATIVVRNGVIPGQGAVLQTLYLRQGEGADYVMHPGEPNGSGAAIVDNRAYAKKFSPYNLTSPDRKPASAGTPLAINGGVFVTYPSQAGAFFQWANNNNVRYAYSPVGNASGWQKNYPPLFWETLRTTHETCPNGYRRPNNGSISTDLINPATKDSETAQSLWLEESIILTNSDWGYYADGYFDRGAITSSTSTVPFSTVSSTNEDIAYMGSIFFNPRTKKSLFFPAAGFLDENGQLNNSGSLSTIWTGTVGLDKAYQVHLTETKRATYSPYRYTGASLRCIANENVTLTLLPNGATGGNAVTITAKELSTVTLPGKGGFTKGAEYFSGWNTKADGTGTQYAAGSNIPMPLGGGTLYARWLYMEESEELVIPNKDEFNNTKEVTITVKGGNNNTFSILNEGSKWFTPTILPSNKLRLTAPRSPNSDPRESTITLIHNSDPNYKLQKKVSQHFYTDIPPFNYFSVQFTWVRGDMDIAVEFNGNKRISTGLPPAFDNKTVGFGFQDGGGAINASYVNINGARYTGGTATSGSQSLAYALSNGGLLFWAGDGRISATGESVFFNAEAIDNDNDLERYIKLDVYNAWYLYNFDPSILGDPITMTISAYQGGSMKYSNYLYTNTNTSVYPDAPKANPINKSVTYSNDVYNNKRGFASMYQKVATITYDRKSHKATVQWH